MFSLQIPFPVIVVLHAVTAKYYFILKTLTLQSVVISKNVNKEGSTHNHAHRLGVAQLQPRPYFQRWKHDNLV